MNQEVADRIKVEFERLTGIPVTANYMPMGEAHKPTTLKKGTCGVYVFLTDKHCFKVGKAGSKSNARWSSQHYSYDERLGSSLPKSILKNREDFKKYFPSELHQEIDALEKSTLQSWIKSNLSRIEFLIEDTRKPYALSLLEALAQFHLKPIFEGKYV